MPLHDHTVYLSPRALAILAQMRAIGSANLFPSPMNPQKPLSSMGMLTLLDRMQYRDRTTVHGLCRASFSTWANDSDIARPDVIEACLAHREADRVRAAYNWAGFHAERAALLRAWADFCDGREFAAKATRRRKSAAVVRFPELGAKRTAGTRTPQAADLSSGELLANHR
jgi:hypothetical protein